MRPTLLALGLTLSLAACGGGGDPTSLTDDGYAALNTGDSSTAVSKFADALEGLTETDPDYMRAKMGHIQARIADDAAGAKDEFMALAAKADLSANDYKTLGSKLHNGAAYSEAAVVLDAGVKKFPDDTKFKQMIDEVTAAATAAGDAGALDALGGLGYIGE